MKINRILTICSIISIVLTGLNHYKINNSDIMLINNIEALSSNDQDWVWLKTEKKDELVGQSVSSVANAAGLTVELDSTNTYRFSVGNNNTQTYTNDSDIVCYRFYCGGIGLRCDDTNSGILTVNIHTANQIFIPKSKFGEGFSKLFIYHIYLI
jgi:hypothetical protein